MADCMKKTSNRVAEPKVLTDAEQERQEHRLQDALENDEVMEALKCLHRDQDARPAKLGSAPRRFS